MTAGPIVAWLHSLHSGGPEERITGDRARRPHFFFRLCGLQQVPYVRRARRQTRARISAALATRKTSPNSREPSLDPDESLRDGYRTGEVRTGDGSVIRGVIKNEDTFSLQMMDDHERLHMFSEGRPEGSDAPAALAHAGAAPQRRANSTT